LVFLTTDLERTLSNMAWTAKAAWFVGGAALFALAYGEKPIYDGNYASYALHGLASGTLADDAMVRATDPFPLVSAIVRLVRAAPRLLYVGHALLCGVYLAALVAIFRRLHGDRGALAFGACAVFVHSWLFRDLVRAATGKDWGWYAQGGVAGQYLVGHVFQPSLFGVLLVVALAAFLAGRDRAGLLAVAAAALAHASYILVGAALVFGFACARARDGGARGFARMLALGALALAPAAVLVLLRFPPTDGATFARAQSILADVRIPNHARPHWHVSFWIQGTLIAAALLVERRRATFVVLAAMVAVALSLTIVAKMSGSAALALLFPWRSSVIVMPLAAQLLVARAVAGARGARALTLCAVLLALAAAPRGLRHTLAEAREYDAAPEAPLVRWVAAHHGGGELYAIPVGLERFRIETGAPVFVDWKTHPYRDVEVIAWYERIEAAKRLQASEGDELCVRAAALPATHFVFPAAKRLGCDSLVEKWRDGAFALYARRSISNIVGAPAQAD
jgi:hypothetical protein